MITKINKNIIELILISLVLFSCDSFLDEIPDNRTEMDTPEKITELLVNAYPSASYVSFLEPRSDNTDDKGDAAGNSYRIDDDMYFWTDWDENDSDFPSNYWTEAYKAISHANHALESIEKLKDQKLDHLKGEALLARAYAHFMLVNIWGKTYNPNTAATDLGVPYVTESETVLIKNYKRNTVKEVYEYIEKDLLAGLPLLTNDYIHPKFHFTTAAANAFASRFYTYIGEWQKVINHSSIVLGGDSSIVLRGWNGFYAKLSYSDLAKRYSSKEDPANLLLVSAASGYQRMYASERYQLSTDLRDELFSSSSNPTGVSWAYKIYGQSSLFLNIPKYEEYFKYTNQSANIGYAFNTFVLFSTDEVLFNRAEAYVMLNQPDKAVDDINAFLSVKTKPNNDPSIDIDVLTLTDLNDFYETTVEYQPFYTIPADKLALIHGITEMRRREFFNEGLRWFDIKRFNLKIIHKEYNGTEHVLEKEDPRKQLQLPKEAISFGLQPNPR